VGVVCRNRGGMFVSATASVFPGVTDPTVLETLAGREALVLAEDMNSASAPIARELYVTLLSWLGQHPEGGHLYCLYYALCLRQ
jgi:hypothetical protein